MSLSSIISGMIRWCLLICWTPLLFAQGDRARAMLTQPQAGSWRPYDPASLKSRHQTVERCSERTGEESYVEQVRHPVVPDDAFHRHVAHEWEICLLPLFARVCRRLARSTRRVHTHLELWSPSRFQRDRPDSRGSGGSACDSPGRDADPAPSECRSSRQPACGNPPRRDWDLRWPAGAAQTACPILLEVRGARSQ